MITADDFQQVTSQLLYWEVYDPSVKCDLSANAIITPEGLVFVDPVPLREEALELLLTFGKPRAIVLTNGNHRRAAVQFRQQFEVPVCGAEKAGVAAEIQLDQMLDGNASVAGMKVVEIEGAAAGEIALVGFGLVCVGDSLVNLPGHEFSILPDKYCDSPKTLRRSLRKLLQSDFEVMTFAHGAPLLTQGRERLELLLS